MNYAHLTEVTLVANNKTHTSAWKANPYCLQILWVAIAKCEQLSYEQHSHQVMIINRIYNPPTIMAIDQ